MYIYSGIDGDIEEFYWLRRGCKAPEERINGGKVRERGIMRCLCGVRRGSRGAAKYGLRC